MEYQPKKRYTLEFKAEVTYQIKVECDNEHQALTTIEKGEFEWDELIEVECDADYSEPTIVDEEDLTDENEEEDED